MNNSDAPLRRLIAAIVTGNSAEFSRSLAETPALATARFEATDATRQSAKEKFLAEVGKYIYRGDTALHFAAAAYNTEMIHSLLEAGADVHAKNRLGDEPLHAAATGNPGAEHWNPSSQSASLKALVQAGADPNTVNKMGVAPLNRAVRTRCAAAVMTLIALGADPAKTSGSGTSPMRLASINTGRGGSGSPEAKRQQHKILQLLKDALANCSGSSAL